MRYIDNTQPIETSDDVTVACLNGNLLVGADADPARPSDCIVAFLRGAWSGTGAPQRSFDDDTHAHRIRQAVRSQIAKKGSDWLALEDADYAFLVRAWKERSTAVFPDGGMGAAIYATFRDAPEDAPHAAAPDGQGCPRPALVKAHG